jgi:DNA ligase (NAD+)
VSDFDSMFMAPDTDALAKRLRAASDAYYNGQPIMSDAEYDALEDSLRKVDPDHPVFALVGAPTSSGWPKVTHPIPMGSLDKAQTDEEFLDWAAKMKGDDLVVTEKLDGISILLTYEEGKLVRAETRGDGEVGEDITRNVRIMQGVQPMIPYEGTIWIRGEVVCRKSDFAAHFQGESNPRNTASGTAKRQSGWQKAKHLTVIAYNLTTKNPDHGNDSRSGEFETLKEWGFQTPPLLHAEDAAHVIEYRQTYIDSLRDLCDYDIDGLVVEVDNSPLRHAKGQHNHRPKGAIAFKFPHDAKPTVLRDIQWQVGPSGRVTPVAIFDPVDLAGASVEKASLHNVGNIARLVESKDTAHFAVGDEILVSRRNDVIPFVESLLVPHTTGKILLVPGSCPACDSNLEMHGEYLVCRFEDCPAQALGALKRWVSKVGVLHFGEALLTAVVDAGMVETIPDLYRLDADAVGALEVDGRRVGGSAKRALDSLHAKKDLPLDLLVGSLGIPLVGRKMARLLVDAGINNLDLMASVTEDQMAAIAGFGPGRAKSFREGFDARKDLIEGILAAGVTLAAPVVVEQTSDVMAGHAVCFSGVRDKDAEAAIVAAGGRIASGVSKNTTLLVLKDVASASSKAKKARDLGIEIVDLAEVRSRLGLS